MSVPKKRRFQLFNLAKDGKESGKNGKITNFNLVNFFVLLWRRLGTIFTVNLFYVFGNFPAWFFLLGRSGFFGEETRRHASILYPTLRAAVSSGYNPVTAALAGVLGQRSVNYVLNTFSYVLIGLSLLTVFTFGPVNAGCAYILRNAVKSEPIFALSDFFYAIKKNLKQSLLFGILDSVLLFLLGYDAVFFYYNAANGGDFIKSAMFFVAVFIGVIYFVMRFYIYVMMVTFDLSVWKLIKNGFIFSVVGFKRNFLACVGIILCVILFITLLSVYMPLGVIMPFVILFGLCSFMAIYASYPKIKQIMIDPYYPDKEEKEPEDAEDAGEDEQDIRKAGEDDVL